MPLRVGFAILTTILLLPFLGFSVFGFLHAWGEGGGRGWVFGYLAANLGLVGAIVAAWALVFSFKREVMPGCCEDCGQNLGPQPPMKCPECGRPTGQ